MKHVVEILFVGPQYTTGVWISQRAIKELKKLRKFPELGRLLEKIEYWAETGFEKWEGAAGSGMPIVHEGDGVFRLGYQSLHRILGFYECDNKRSFIAIDVFQKRGQGLSASERRYVAEVARVKRMALWEKFT